MGKVKRLQAQAPNRTYKVALKYDILKYDDNEVHWLKLYIIINCFCPQYGQKIDCGLKIKIYKPRSNLPELIKKAVN